MLFVRAAAADQHVVGGKTPVRGADRLTRQHHGIVPYADAALQGAVAGKRRPLTAAHFHRVTRPLRSAAAAGGAFRCAIFSLAASSKPVQASNAFYDGAIIGAGISG